MFQSTPVIANGRINVNKFFNSSISGFNPRPLLLTGESGAPTETSSFGVRRFNPRPLLLTGESAEGLHVVRAQVVSIHARYC